MQTCQSHAVKITENWLWIHPSPAPALLDIPPGKNPESAPNIFTSSQIRIILEWWKLLNSCTQVLFNAKCYVLSSPSIVRSLNR